MTSMMTDPPIYHPPKGWPLIVQTWPKDPPAFRSYAFCHMARQVVIDQFDNTPILAGLDDPRVPGIILIEWDMALGRDEIRTVARRAALEPDEGFVCPYRLPWGCWAHRIGQFAVNKWWQGPEDERFYRWVTEEDKACDLPAFGCIYLPRPILEEWAADDHTEHGQGMTDTTFALWARSMGYWWPILWDVRPVHLHY